MNHSIYHSLKEYAKSNTVRMHMPGHKGKGKGYDIDITEITDFDNLHSPQGIILDSMKLAAKLWKSKESFYLVNGSTCGLLSSIRAMTKRGDKVLCSRNCHKAVFHAIELCGLKPVFVMPAFIKEWGIFGSVSPESINDILEKEKDIKLVIITSPTYEGVISDVKAISKEVHKRDIPLIVDEAHGTHLGFNLFPKGAVECGADVVIQSLHKTLNCLTQSAILHVLSDRVSRDEICHQLSVFETSSPSYILMASMDSCIREINDNQNAFKKWTTALEYFYEESKKIKSLQILGNCYKDYKEIYDYDKSKIVIAAKTSEITSYQLFETLKSRYNIECEMVSEAYVLAMTGMGDNKHSVKKLCNALTGISKKYFCGEAKAYHFLYSEPEMKVLPETALNSERELVSLKEAGGRISGEYVWAYPPGIPILIPGEIVPNSLINQEIDFSKLKSSSGNLPESIAVLKG